jgi:hypothetical protein
MIDLETKAREGHLEGKGRWVIAMPHKMHPSLGFMTAEAGEGEGG